MLNSIQKILCSLVMLLRRLIVAGKGLWKVETIKLKIGDIFGNEILQLPNETLLPLILPLNDKGDKTL